MPARTEFSRFARMKRSIEHRESRHGSRRRQGSGNVETGVEVELNRRQMEQAAQAATAMQEADRRDFVSNVLVTKVRNPFGQ